MKTITKYESDDGEVFNTLEECQAYERKTLNFNKSLSYYIITSSPDLTEGRGYSSLLGLGVYFDLDMDISDEIFSDYCYEVFGRKIKYLEGDYPMVNWTAKKVEEETFLNKLKDRIYVSCGDYKYHIQEEYLYIDEKKDWKRFSTKKDLIKYAAKIKK